MKTIKTQNEGWGFFGTLRSSYDLDHTSSEVVFSTTANLLAEACKVDHEMVRKFLDSRYGRHFADELSFHGAEEGIHPDLMNEVVREFIKKAKKNGSWVLNECKHYVEDGGF